MAEPAQQQNKKSNMLECWNRNHEVQSPETDDATRSFVRAPIEMMPGRTETALAAIEQIGDFSDSSDNSNNHELTENTTVSC